MRKAIIITCCAVVLILATISILLPTMKNQNNVPVVSSDTFPTESSSTAPVQSQTEERYTIREYQGNIAVFMDGVDHPFRITDVDVHTLPKMDQEQLSQGIQVNSTDELNRLLEDYSSWQHSQT